MHADSVSDIAFAISSIPFILIGIAGNILVIQIVHSSREMRSTTNYLIVNLAVSDFLTLMFWPVYWKLWWRHEFPNGKTGEFLCKTFSGVAIVDVFLVVQSLTLTALAIERYNALVKPFHTRLRLSRDNVASAIAVIWVLSFLCCLPDFVLRHYDETLQTCIGPWTIHMNRASRIYVICNLTFTVLLPFTVLLFSYGSLINGLYFSNTICSESRSTQDWHRDRERKQLVITFALVTSVFFLCFFPLALLFLHLASRSKERTETELERNDIILQIFWFLLMCSSSFNPIFYAFRSTNFREGFKRALVFLHRGPNRVQNTSIQAI